MVASRGNAALNTDVMDRHAQRYHVDTHEVHMFLQQWLNDTAQVGLITMNRQTVSLCAFDTDHLLCRTCRQLVAAFMQDAAELYERAGLHEKAATIYIQCRAFALAAPLMALITHNPKLQLEFAKAKESELCAQRQTKSSTCLLAFAPLLHANVVLECSWYVQETCPAHT